ncbi:MAG: prolyl oligopeptidase family serine peptidase [Acidobacteriota bacterium]
MPYRHPLLSTALVVLLSLPATSITAERIERGNRVMEGIPEIPPEIEQRIRQYQNTRSAVMRGWHPSGEGLLISTRFGETSQLHWVKSPGGARHQLTFFEEPISEVVVVPPSSQAERGQADRQWVVLGRDVGGSENFQLYLYDLENATSRLLTDGKSRNGSLTVSNRGDRVAFHTTRRNGRDWDLHLLDLASDEPSRPILEKPGVWFAIDWSFDDTQLMVARFVSANEIHPYRLDLASGELTSLRSTDTKIAYGDFSWAPGRNGAYFTSDEGSEFLELKYIDFDTGDIRSLTRHIPWDIRDLTVSPDGKWLAFAVNEGGAESFHLWDTATYQEQRLAPLPVGQVFAADFSPDSQKLAIVLNTPQTPGDVFVIDLASREHERWTHSEVGGLDTSRFGATELIHFDTFDQVDGKPRQIPAFYYRPAEGEGPWPVLIDIHGGPEGQHRPGFDPGTQYLVSELGIAVVAPNVRGSSGYGKSYLKLDNGRLREDSVKDIGKLLDWIASRDELDASRVAVSGGSYGGYMVLASLVHFGDRLRGGIDVVGISNFVTFLENTEEYRQDMRRAEYGDERDPEMRAFLENISPANSASKIRQPLFIAQGANDPRVPASEAEQILAAVRANGGEPWYLLFKDEGHGFRKKSNRDFFSSASALFLEKILKGD